MFEVLEITTKTAAVDDRVVKADNMIQQAVGTLFTFKIGKYIGKREGSARIKACAPHILHAQQQMSAPLRSSLLPVIADWAGLGKVDTEVKDLSP